MQRMNIPPQVQQQLQMQMKNFNPSVVLNQIANNPELANHPRIKNVLDLRNSHDSKGLNEMATNIFKENGKDFSQFANSVKKQMGFG